MVVSLIDSERFDSKREKVPYVMPHTFTHREYADMIFVYGFCNGSALRAVDEYRRRFPNRRVPNRKVFQKFFANAQETGMFPSVRIDSEREAGLNVENEENVLDMAEENPGVSTRRITKELRLESHVGVWKTLRKNGLKPFHVQPVQHLQEGDYGLRVQFCEWIQQNRGLHKYILFSDEAQFTRDGINNCHNEHRWSDENLHATFERNFQHRFSINVWCGMLNDQLFGPFVLNERLTGDGYLRFLEDHLTHMLDDVPLIVRHRMFFQHDGAPPHFSRRVRNFLNNRFPDRWIGRGGPQAWPPRSPDLNPLDYCLWGWMKSLVYETRVETVEGLHNRIFNAANIIINNPQAIQRATRAINKRAAACIEVGGGIFENILN